VSNTRHVARARTRRQPCARCGRGIRPGRGGVGLRDGRAVCAACADTGVLSRRLPCGHVSVAGMLVIDEGGSVRCPRCADSYTVDYLTRKEG
jgi:hypothetical protein